MAWLAQQMHFFSFSSYYCLFLGHGLVYVVNRSEHSAPLTGHFTSKLLQNMQEAM